jgi:recombination protein RecR
LSRLPGIGRRSGERMAIKLVHDPVLLRDLTQALREATEELRCCSRCGAITRASEDPCRLCTDHRRDDALLCVVEDPSDIVLIEKSRGFNGRYHALMGRLSPMNGKGPADLRIEPLLRRVAEGKVTEVLLALNTDVESDATAGYLCHLLKDRKVKVTRLATGLPAGSGVMYADPLTLARAIEGRQPV